MICKKCGKEIQDGINVCPYCGIGINGAVPNTSGTAAVAEKPKKKHKGLMIFCYITAILLLSVIVIAIFADDEGESKTVSEKEYIIAAENIIKKDLKAPSTAIFSNEKIADEDEYGRKIVTFTVESQNSFGGYVTSNCYVLITGYDSNDDSFTYNAATGVITSEQGFDFLEESYIKKLKESTEWNQPQKEE
ncbi:zinc ribbon domain-containing protein [Ruminococcus flavefaciens]|uniref:Zinc ribbon protein n=1 Tax=Ruminococcus flavefaciens TaxID=1265 RepID=A0A315XYA1_RUMFL|nr:zinc ribbon domain-containing protein [Ruminococcus flavefaciens]MBQ6169843.1 zinc ribbon domain-containing protein [Ruminococcus sp.]PWJ12273.1 zinc ribbon protein [Ruminococcus flavefaciens]SSA49763.1 zinc-ribbon domain-containing protein [Ruminococcus flavefaciens]